MFAVPVLATLYLAVLLLPIPYWSRSRTVASTPSHQHSSAPSSSARAGSTRLPDPRQRQQRQPRTWFPSRQLCWAGPDWYWRVPGARILLVLVFRIFLSVLPPLSVGILKPTAPLLQFNGYLQWSPFVQYAWRGWGAFTQLVGGGASQHARCLSAGMLVIGCSTRRARCLPVALPPCVLQARGWAWGACPWAVCLQARCNSSQLSSTTPPPPSFESWDSQDTALCDCCTALPTHHTPVVLHNTLRF